MTTIRIENGNAKSALEKSGCPACGEDIRDYEPADDNQYEYFRFQCDCELLVGDAGLEVESHCENATRAAIEQRVVYVD